MFSRILVMMVLGGMAILSGQRPAVSYSRDIEPIFAKSCVSCHKVTMAAGGLRLDAPENVLQGGASGAAVIPGKAEGSLLYQRLLDTTAKRMPPVGVLTEEQTAMIRAWINLGAKIDPPSQKSGPKAVAKP